MKEAIRSAMAGVESNARAKGISNRFRYLNYAGVEQRVFESYGKENRVFLQAVSQAYEPDRLFQQASVGGFKLYEAKC